MELMIEGELAEQFIVLIRKEHKLAKLLAEQLLREPWADKATSFLMSESTVVDLLAERLRNDPQKTLEALQSLAKGEGPAASKKTRKRRQKGVTQIAAAPIPKPKTRGRGRAKAKAVVKAGAVKAKAKPKTKRRKRLNTDEIGQLKASIIKHLGERTWSTRKEIVASTSVPTEAIYNRVMVELRRENRIVIQGKKSKTVYGLVTASAPPPAVEPLPIVVEEVAKVEPTGE
jgi:hypothetical protein